MVQLAWFLGVLLPITGSLDSLIKTMVMLPKQDGGPFIVVYDLALVYLQDKSD